MADKTEIRMNLAAIKKVDPYAKDIIDSSAHVAFYTFNSVDNEWEKTDVEGAFFIYSRIAEPYQSIFINNRLNTNSFVEPITSKLELQSQPPFLLYRNERSRIRGFWFYNSAECDRIGDLVNGLVRNCSDTTNHQQCQLNNGNAIKTTNNIDIFTMLSNAQQSFKSSQTVNKNPILNHSLSLPGGIVNSQKPTGSSKNDVDGTSESVMNFFASAKPASASEVPLFQRLISNPVNPVSVDQIEKQQRAATPSDGKMTPTHSNCEPTFVDNSNKKLFPTMQQQQTQADVLASSPLAKFLGQTNLTAASTGLIKSPSIVSLKNQANIARQLIASKELLTTTVPTTPKPALMPPTMFATSTLVVQNNNTNNIPKLSQDHDTTNTPEPLTQTQLVQALTYLIKNDPGFIKQLHEAYLKSFTEMISL